MTDNTITITLDDVLGPDGLEGAWDAMVRKLTDRAEGKLVHSDAGQSFHKAAVKAIDAAVEERIKEKISDLMEKKIQMTDNYGSPKGDPVTFDQMIGDAIQSIATTKIDGSGRRDRYGKTPLQRALEELAAPQLKIELAKVVKEFRETAKKQMAAAMADAIEKAAR